MSAVWGIVCNSTGIQGTGGGKEKREEDSGKKGIRPLTQARARLGPCGFRQATHHLKKKSLERGRGGEKKEKKGTSSRMSSLPKRAPHPASC